MNLTLPIVGLLGLSIIVKELVPLSCGHMDSNFGFVIVEESTDLLDFGILSKDVSGILP